MEVIIGFFLIYDYFTGKFLQQYKRNANITYFIPIGTKKIIKEIALEGGIFPLVVMILRSIMNTKVMKEASVKYKDNNNKSSMNPQTVYTSNSDYSSVGDKIKKRSSEVIKE